MSAVLAVTHLRKSPGAAIYRAMGSLAFAAAARAVWGVVANESDKSRRLLLAVKQNLAPDGGELAYSIEAPHGIARIAWEPGAVDVDVNTIMGGFESRGDHSERREAEEWLRDFLGDGPAAAAEVLRESRSAGLSRTTVWRAAQSLRVVKRKLGGLGAAAALRCVWGRVRTSAIRIYPHFAQKALRESVSCLTPWQTASSRSG